MMSTHHENTSLIVTIVEATSTDKKIELKPNILLTALSQRFAFFFPAKPIRALSTSQHNKNINVKFLKKK